MPWAEAGAAPYDNISRLDPGLRDPQQGDFRADLATGYGCRVFASPGPVSSSRHAANAPPLAPPAATVRAARHDAGGIIDKDTVWDAALVRVTADIEIIDGATLTVAPGVRVEFSGFWGLTVRDGSLQAVGAPQAPILWTSERPDLWQPDTQPQGAWNGLAFDNVPAARDSSRLRWCILEHAKALPARDDPAGDGRPAGGPAAGGAGRGGQLDAGCGGAVRVAGASPLVISHCILRRNFAERGGAVSVHYGASPLLVNNLWHDNHASLRGAALYASCSYPILVHNTLTANTTLAGLYVHTGGVDHAHAKPLHVGGIVWGNPTDYYGGTQIRAAKAFYTRYCNVENWLGGEGCQTADPQLDAASVPPFRPRPGSPVVDAGNAAAAMPWLPHVDLAGGPRLDGAAPDLGACEFVVVSAATPTADVALRLTGAPNPFNPQVVLSWRQARAGEVRLTIHDARGRRVRTLASGGAPAGEVQLVWDGADARQRRLPAGVYLARLQTEAGAACLKLIMAP